MTRLHIPIALRWADLDAYGHVNNAVMLRLLEEARIQAFWAPGTRDGGVGEDTLHAPTAVIDASSGTDTITLIARQEVEYLAPVPYLRQPLDVQLWISRLGGASLDVDYEVWSPPSVEPAILYVRASTTIVLANAQTERPRRIVDAERSAWQPYLGEQVAFSRRR